MEPIIKRLANLSQILVVIFLVAIVGAFRRCGVSELRDDTIALRSLADLDGFVAKRDRAATAKEVRTVVALRQWLSLHDPTDEPARQAVRAAFSKWLSNRCASDPDTCSYEPMQFGKGPSATTTTDKEISLVMAKPHGAADPPTARHARTVDADLADLAAWGSPLDVRWVSADTSDQWTAEWTPRQPPEPKQPDGGVITAETPMERFDHDHPPPRSPTQAPPRSATHPSPQPAASPPAARTRVRDIQLTDERDRTEIRISFEGEQAAQSAVSPVYVGATTSGLTGRGPSLLDLRWEEVDPSIAQLPTTLDARQRTRLHEKYGPLPTDKALEIATDELGAAYKSVDVFGFSILPLHLPLTLVIVNLVVVLLMVSTLRSARTKRGSLAVEELEDAIFPVIRNPAFRTILWILMPVVSVWIPTTFDLPAFTRGGWARIVMVLGTTVLIALGIAATRIANELWSTRRGAA